MNRLREQAELIYKLGRLLGPLESIAETPDSFDRFERTRIIARFTSDFPKFVQDAGAFTTGEPGHNYYHQWAQINSILNHLASVDADTLPTVIDSLKEKRARLIDHLSDIPVPVDSAIYDARTPFATYCFVRDLCLNARTDIVWLDRYFDHTLFHRYLADTPRSATIVLVTWPESKANSPNDRTRVQNFLDVSRDFARDRGPTGYRLIVNDDFHDRWLRCDERMFTLGGSIKDIGKGSTFTISRLDDTPTNQRAFADATANGTELFGPNQTTRR